VAEFKAAGCQRVFQEKINGARRTASNWRGCWLNWDDGDMVVVTRLARSTRDLLNTLAAIGAANARRTSAAKPSRDAILAMKR
jgi:hypothetical protein